MGGKQLGFGDYDQSTAKNRTKREKFLAEIEPIVPVKALIELMEPNYPKTSSKSGHPANLLATMLLDDLIETAKAHIRAEGENPFRVIKQQLAFQKTRLQGMLNNRCKLNMLAASADLFFVRLLLLSRT